MDKLKGKRIMVWTFMGNARMYEALRDYGDRLFAEKFGSIPIQSGHTEE